MNGVRSCGIVSVCTVCSWSFRVVCVINDSLLVLALHALKGQCVTFGLICDFCNVKTRVCLRVCGVCVRACKEACWTVT